ncbi:hypothetical protein MKX01_027619 [Papaver californicum]|nr:hypothetical protein MKX01_027619 [Papaver californicum]
MAAASSSTFPPPCHHLPHLHQNHPKSLSLSPFKPKSRITKFSIRPLSVAPKASLCDPFVLQIAETLEDSNSYSSIKQSPILQKLRESSSESILSLSWPTRKDEPFRFTDTSFIKNSQISSTSPDPESNPVDFESDGDDDTQTPNIVIVDGQIVSSRSKLDELPDNVYVGSVLGINSDEIREKVMKFVSNFEDRDLFWSLNGIGAPDVTIVYVPSDCFVEKPLRFRFYSHETSEIGSSNLPMSNPRVLVLVEKGGEVGIVEEYVGGAEDKCYWVNSVMEVLIGEGGKVSHTYVQQQAPSAAHFKWTSVRQESSSTYKLVEVSSGGKLSRHNLHIQQVGPDTITELSTFHICVRDQTQDLHSRLILDHPRGIAQQRHKCIAAHSRSQVVFDGNIKVNRLAKQTDAAQLSRTLLLEDSATVNMMPNLQIIANDVSCSHGATVCDVDEDQLFYLLTRGIDLETARKSLIFAFGTEVMSRLPCESLQKKVERHIQRLLDPTPS